jgi:hypothetical protein
MSATFLGHNAVRGKVRPQPLDDQFFGCAIGRGHQVEFTLQLEGHAPFKKSSEQRAGFARDFNGSLEWSGHSALSAFLDQVLNLVFIDKQIRTVSAGQADKRVIVILDRAGNLFAVGEPHSHRHLGFDQPLEVSHFFEGLFGGAIAGVSTVS